MAHALRVLPCLYTVVYGLAPIIPSPGRPAALPSSVAVASPIAGMSPGTPLERITSLSSRAPKSSLRGQSLTQPPMMPTQSGLGKADSKWMNVLNKDFPEEQPMHAATAWTSPWNISTLLLVTLFASALFWRRQAQASQKADSQTELSSSVLFTEQPKFAAATHAGKLVDVGLPGAAAANAVSSSSVAAPPLTFGVAPLNFGVGAEAPPALMCGARSAAAALGTHNSFCAAGRGVEDAGAAARGALVVRFLNGKIKRYNRRHYGIKWCRAPYAADRRYHRWKKYALHMRRLRTQSWKFCKQAVIKKFQAQKRDKFERPRRLRTKSIFRVTANCKLHGVEYRDFIMWQKEAYCNINRAMLAQIAIYDRPVFTSIMDVVQPKWKEFLAKKNFVQPKLTTEEIDKKAIKFIEDLTPNIYTSPTTRFNRKASDWGVTYTVDVGSETAWRELLAKTPEMADFNIPEHWIENPNAQFEEWPLEYLTADESDPSEEKKEKKARKPAPKARVSSREDWFKEEPMSWG